MSVFSSVEDCINIFSNGGMVIVMDDEDRENEGDIFLPAQFANETNVAFIIRYTTGILCTSMLESWAEQLSLPKMVTHNTDPNGTAFTVTCDHLDAGTGVSSYHRSITIRALADPSTTPNQLRRPGHIFPLVARSGGIFERRGHTEASVDLCRLANLHPVCLLSELCNDDGKMMRLKDCKQFSKDHNIPLLSIQRLYEYRLAKEGAPTGKVYSIPNTYKVEQVAQCNIPVQFDTEAYLGMWHLRIFVSLHDRHQHVVLIKGEISQNQKKPILTRIHSECLTGNTLGSVRCDCGPQLKESMKIIQEEGCGIVIYVAGHEGRGIGLINKIRAYEVQSKDLLDTYQANCALGFPEDIRDYKSSLAILESLNVKSIELLTNNPEKMYAFKDITRSVRPLLCPPNEHNKNYFIAKQTYHENRFKILNITKPEISPSLTEIDNKNLSSESDTKSIPCMSFKQSSIAVPTPSRVRSMRIGIVHTAWNKSLVQHLVEGCLSVMQASGLPRENVRIVEVPGSFELPITTQIIAKSGTVDAILCIGILVKGDTMHFEFLSQAVVNGLMKVQLKTGVPVLNGVLNCITLLQAEERCVGPNSLARSLALSTLQMAGVRQSLGVLAIEAVRTTVSQPCTDVEDQIESLKYPFLYSGSSSPINNNLKMVL